MNNLHRELAPISDAAWGEIEEEAARTFKRNLAGRRVVDVQGPDGVGLASVATGHRGTAVTTPDGVQARQREVAHVVEFTVPFVVQREDVDDVERGSLDSDWQPVKDAAKQLAFAEDRAIFTGFADGGIQGIAETTSNTRMTLPEDAREFPDVVAQGMTQLRLAGVEGPYHLVVSADAYTRLNETRDHGYPVYEQVARQLESRIVWAPAIEGAVLLSTRGGDYDLHLGQDTSIGYQHHDDESITLYLTESFTFRPLTEEASVVFTA